MVYDPSAWGDVKAGQDRDAAVGVVVDLIEANRDASHGLRMAAEILEDLPIAPKLIEKAKIRDEFASKLAVLMARYGVGDDIPEGGTRKGRRFGWRLQIATALKKDDRAAVLDLAVKGNKSMQDEYDEALNEAFPPDVRRVIQAQYNEIRETGEWLEEVR